MVSKQDSDIRDEMSALARAGGGGERLRIGIVDSSPAVLEALRKWLSFAGIGDVVGTATSLQEARQTWREVKLDVLLLDVRHPNQLPTDAVASFKQTSPETRVILMSHYSLEGEGGNVSAGADACLGKADLVERLVPTLIQMFPDRRLFA